MEYVRFGSTGMKVSRICLGCMSYGGPNERWPWALDEETSRPFIQRALELGINFFDTANVYSNGRSEEIVGKALRDFAASRDEVVIATKVYFEMGPGPNDGGLSRKHILSSIDASLKRLGTDYVDLYQIHRPELDTDIDETLGALGELVEEGPSKRIFNRTLHPYTQGLLGAFPSVKGSKRRLEAIPGSPPSLVTPPTGCRFHPRCSYAKDICTTERPPYVAPEPGHRALCHFSQDFYNQGGLART